MKIITEDIYQDLLDIQSKLAPHIVSDEVFKKMSRDRSDKEIREINIMEEQIQEFISYIEENQTWGIE